MLVRLLGNWADGETWKPVLVDEAGHLQIDITTIADGGFLFKVSDHIQAIVSELGSSGGTRPLYSSAVPAGEIWVIQNACAWDETSAPAYVYVGQRNGSFNMACGKKLSPAADELVFINNPMILKAGWKVVAQVGGVVAGDNIYLQYSGYIVKT